jgi:tetratricopeptide (TPR) repeat protein
VQPDHFNSLFFLALRLDTDKINRRPEAIAYLTGCIALRPDSSLAYRNRGNCYLNLGQIDDALVDLRQAIRLPRHAVEDHVNLGHALWHKGRQHEAIAECQKAIREAPNLAMAHNNLAWFLASSPDPKLHDPAQAVEAARKAAELAPEDGNNQSTLGAALYRAGDWKASISALEKSMELSNGGGAFDWFFVAMAHWRLGHKDEARAWYEKAAAWDARNLALPEKEELLGFRAEAAALRRVVDVPEDVFARP